MGEAHAEEQGRRSHNWWQHTHKTLQSNVFDWKCDWNPVKYKYFTCHTSVGLFLQPGVTRPLKVKLPDTTEQIVAQHSAAR